MFARSLVVLVLLTTTPAVFGQPLGKKIIPTSRTVELSQEIPGYAFFTVHEMETPPVPNQPPPLPVYRATRIKFVPKVPQKVPTNLDLQIVPVSALEKYPDEEKLGQALGHALIPGAGTIGAVGEAEEADEADPRTKAEYRFIIHRVDPNAGVIYDRFSNDPDDPRNFTDAQGNPLPGNAASGGAAGGEDKPEGGSRWLIIAVVVVVVVAGVGVGVWIIRGNRSNEDE